MKLDLPAMTITLAPTLGRRAAHAARRTYAYWQRTGWRATLSRIALEISRRLGTAAAAPPPQPQDATSERRVAAQAPAVRPMGHEQLVEAEATLLTYAVPPQGRPRVTLVTDSIGRGHLFGGVGTALIFAALLANRRGADLRVITRIEAPQPANADHVWRANGVALDGESRFVWAPREGRVELDLVPGELVVTTSWWTTAAALPAVPPAQLVYLLQEDERMFYLYGDVRLRCERVLRRDDIRFVVNTRGLFEHLVADGMEHLHRGGLAFEPAFPATLFHPREKPSGSKRRFVFYARPLNPRNLYFLGLEVVEAAIERGVLDPAQWEIVFVGRDIPDVSLPRGCAPVRRENLSWAEYAALIGSTDLGLSLMYTPHPSYPPLDMAASGAVVVTNRHGSKRDLSRYSANLICCDPEPEALLRGLADGAALAEDTARRRANFEAGRLQRDWRQALAAVVEQVAAS